MDLRSLFCRPRSKLYAVELFVDVSGAYRWRIRHANGHVLASSEAYSSKAAAEETAQNLARAAFFPFVIEEVRP